MVCICMYVRSFLLCLQKGKQIEHVKRIFAFFRKILEKWLTCHKYNFSISYTPILLTNQNTVFPILLLLFLLTIFSCLWVTYGFRSLCCRFYELLENEIQVWIPRLLPKYFCLHLLLTSNSTLYFYTATNAVFDTTFFWPISNFFPFFTFWLVG